MRRLLVALLVEALRLAVRAAVCFGLGAGAAFLCLLGRKSLTLSQTGLSLLLAAFLFAAWGRKGA